MTTAAIRPPGPHPRPAGVLTVRPFTRAEQADQHCQMGNLELACGVLTDWLRRPPGPAR